MAIGRARDALSRVFFQRCFYLFIVLLVLVTIVPFIEETPKGRIAVSLVNAFVVIAAVAAVGRNVLSFVIAVLLAVPALVFHYLGVTGGDVGAIAFSWVFGAALCGATVVYLLLYVFQPEVMTADKLYGAAAAYLLIGVVWAYFYALIDFYYPGSFSTMTTRGGTDTVVDFLYFSFTVLTSTGFGDVVPVSRQARAICVVEQIVGGLFVAILIARLAGVYPPHRREPR
jgi:hypothetical protein